MAIKTGEYYVKCIYTTNCQSESTYPLLFASINSLLRNTDLEPVVIWGGKWYGNDHEITRDLAAKGVEVIPHTLSFDDQLDKLSFDNVDYSKMEAQDLGKVYQTHTGYFNDNFIATESLRLDIPNLFPDEEYVLYVDCDTIFLQQPKFVPFDTPLGAAVRPSEDFFNNGVMFMNLPKLRETADEFIEFYLKSNYEFEIGGIATQGAYNTFYRGQATNFTFEFNWHAYWGASDNVQIIHYCGPKPRDYINILKEVKDPLNNSLTYDPLYLDYFRQLYFKGDLLYMLGTWNRYAESSDRLLIDPQYFA